MNIYKYALQLEKESENYYHELVQKTENIGLQNILRMLADEEATHYKIIEKMMKGDVRRELAETDLLKKVKNLFMKIKEKR